MATTEGLGISEEKIHSHSANGSTIALSLITVVLLLLLIGIAGYYFYKKKYQTRRSADQEELLNDSFFQSLTSESNVLQQNSYEKPTLGDAWHLEKYIDKKGGRISFVKYDVQINFPNDELLENEKAKIYLAVHTDMPAIMNTLKVDRERIIVAPVVECLMPGIKELNKYAELTIPHCVRKSPSAIHVQWFDHNIANPTATDVVMLKSFEDHELSMDIFCVNANDGYLKIYTKHFSTIVCTHHGQIEFDLQASLYGKSGNIDGYPSVHLKLELGGPLMTLRGFWEDHHDKMEKMEFRTLERKMPIDLLPKQVEGSVLHFRIGLIGQAYETWKHVKREGKNEFIYQITQTKNLNDILVCGIENHVIMCSIQWYLVGSYTKVSIIPLHVDIVNVRNMDIHDSEGVKDRRSTTINVEFKICEKSMEIPDLKMKNVLYILSRKMSNEELKKTVSLLDDEIHIPDIENKTEDEQRDSWYRTLIKSSTGKEQNTFIEHLLQVLQIVSDPVLNEVRPLLATSSLQAAQGSHSEETEPKHK